MNTVETNQKVSVYGVLCTADLISLDEIIISIKQDLSVAKDKEVVRIASGEANWIVFNKCEEDFRSAYQKNGLKYEVVAGPILSCCLLKDHRKNGIADLARDGILDLYLSKVRRKLHFRIMGDRLLRAEFPHPPVFKEKRPGYSIDPELLQSEGERENALYAIRQRIKDFDAMKFFSEYVKPEEVKDKVILLLDDEIEKVDQKARKYRMSFDMLSIEEIKRFSKEVR